jgi:hypothetical protein
MSKTHEAGLEARGPEEVAGPALAASRRVELRAFQWILRSLRMSSPRALSPWRA